MERAVLRVDGEDRGAGGARGRHERLARHDERLLVRERERLAELHGLVRGREADRPDDAAEDDVRLRDASPRRRAPARPKPTERPGNSCRSARGVLARLHRHDLRAVRRDRRQELLEVRAGRHRDDLEAVRKVRDDRERRVADRARRAEEGDALLHRGQRTSGRSVRSEEQRPARRRAASRAGRGGRRGRAGARRSPSRRSSS